MKKKLIDIALILLVGYGAIGVLFMGPYAIFPGIALMGLSSGVLWFRYSRKNQ